MWQQKDLGHSGMQEKLVFNVPSGASQLALEWARRGSNRACIAP